MKTVPMKIILSTLVLVFFHLGLTAAREGQKDTAAIVILDEMSAIISDMQSCRFTLHTATDVQDHDLGPVTRFNLHHVWLSGPDNMLITSSGYKGQRGFWYNGQDLLYYSYTENNYAVIEAPETTLATIDAVNNAYGIDFPAADFFYPSFTDDMILGFDFIKLAPDAMVNGQPCFHIVAGNPDMGIQLWISADALFLPQKLIITYYDHTPAMQYEATFSDWEINPVLPDALFTFTPPPGANRITLLAR